MLKQKLRQIGEIFFRRPAPSLALLVFFLLGYAYAPALSSGFLSLDDRSLFFVPQLSAPFSFAQIVSLFVPGNHIDFYPLRDLIAYALNFFFHGSAESYRIFHLFIFSLSAALFFRLLNKRVREEIAFSTAFLWAIHPLHAELLLWVSASKDLLALFFVLLSLNFFANKRFISCVFAYQASLFCKASFLFLPLLAPVYYWYFRQEKKQPVWLVPITLLQMAANALLQSWFYSKVNPMRVDVAWTERYPIFLSAVGKSIAGIFIPAWNTVEADNWGEWYSLNSGYLSLGVTFFLLLLFVPLVMRKNREVSFLFFAMIVFACGMPNAIFPYRGFYAIRYLEPVFLFGAGSLALGFAQMKEKIGERYFRILAMSLALLFVYLCIWEGERWRNGFQLRLQALVQHPSSIVAKSDMLSEVLNRHQESEPEMQELRVRLVKDLSETCAALASSPVGARNPHLSCRFFYTTAYQAAFWKHDFPQAEIYLQLLRGLVWGNVFSQRQVERLSLQLALANGKASRQEAERWLSAASYTPDVTYRALRIVSYCLLDDFPSAYLWKRKWRKEGLFRQEDEQNFVAETLAPELRKLWEKCLKD